MNSRAIEHVEFLFANESARRLAVFSHGSGSTPRAMRGLAEHLVDRGWIAAMIEHPGNHRGDNRLADSVEILEQRPRDVTRAIDEAAKLFDIAGVAVLGHSLGAYTALAVAGGAPWSLPNQGTPRALDVVHDPRVRAVVLLAPAIPWFMPAGSVANVHAKVMVRAGERDEMAPPAFIETVLRDLPKDYAVVPNGGHFAFFWPVPPHLLALPPGKDPPGFDRAAYQPQLCAEVAAFLEFEIEADDLRQDHDQCADQTLAGDDS